MILPARLLPEKILRHVTKIMMHTLIKFGMKNDRFIKRLCIT